MEGKKAALDGYIPKQGKTLFIDKCREEKGVAMDTVEFDRGFASGLTKLCTPEGREKLEERGLKYQGTCEMHEDNLNLKKSRTIELEAEVSRLKAEIESLKSRECPAEPEPVD